MGCVGEREVGGEDICDLLGIGSERKESLQQVLCYRTGAKTGGFGSQGAKGEVWIHYQSACFPDFVEFHH